MRRLIFALLLALVATPLYAQDQPRQNAFSSAAMREWGQCLTADGHFGACRLAADPTCTTAMEGRLWELTSTHLIRGCLNGTAAAVGGAGGASTFDGIGSGTNTTAAMVVGNGATLAATGTGTITATAVPVGGVSGLGTGVATFLATPSGANLASALTTALPVSKGGTNATSASITAFNNITGYSAAGSTGTTSTNIVFSTSPSLTTPTLGVFAASAGSTVTLGSGSGTATVGGVICKGTGSGTASTSEEVMATCTIPANTLSANGSMLRVTFLFHTAANANNKRVRVRIGGLAGTLVCDNGGMTANNQDLYQVTPLTVIRNAATTATASCGVYALADASAGAPTANAHYAARAASITWANSNDLVLTGQTPTATGDLTLDSYSIEVIQ